MAVAPIPDMPRPGDRAISSRFLEWIANAAQRILTLSTDAGGVVQGPNGTSIIMPSAADEPIWVQIEGDPVTDDPLSSISAVEILPKKGGDKEVKELGRKFGDDYPDRLFPAPGEEVPDTGKVVQAWPWLKRLEKSPDPPAPGDSTDPYKYIQEWVVMGTGESAEPCKDWKFYCRARRIKCMDDDPEGGDPDPDPDPACVPISDLKICFDDTIWLVGVRFWASYYGSGPVQYLWSFSGGGGRRGYITNAPEPFYLTYEVPYLTVSLTVSNGCSSKTIGPFALTFPDPRGKDCGPCVAPYDVTINYTLAGERTYKFTSSFSGSHIGVIYEWHFSDGTTSALAEPTHTFAGLGPYFASLTVRNDCGGETSEILNLCIPPSITGVSVSVDGYRVIVTVNYLGSYEHCVIDWNDGSSPTEGISQVHTYPPMPRTYTLTVTLSGCGQTVIVAANVAVPVGGPIDG